MNILSLSIFCLFFVKVNTINFQDIKTEADIVEVANSLYKLLKFKPLTTIDSTPIEEDVTFWCANMANPKFQQVLPNEDSITSKLMPDKNTVFVIHGWNSKWANFKSVGESLLKFFDINVCVVDYERLSKYEYMTAVRTHAPKIGAFISASFIQRLKIIGIRLDSITIVGHSLGAHIAGHVGSSVKGQIAQIVGLDPAGPLFTFPILQHFSNRLDRSDAKFVQTIVTNKNQLGTGMSLGHQNFYPNGGENPQPICEFFAVMLGVNDLVTISCSHSFSVDLFRASLDPGIKFTARKCQSYRYYLNNNCKMMQASTDRLGVYSQKIYGDFFLQTSAEAPYISDKNDEH